MSPCVNFPHVIYSQIEDVVTLGASKSLPQEYLQGVPQHCWENRINSFLVDSDIVQFSSLFVFVTERIYSEPHMVISRVFRDDRVVDLTGHHVTINHSVVIRCDDLWNLYARDDRNLKVFPPFPLRKIEENMQNFFSQFKKGIPADCVVWVEN
ncbi:MAG: hypothetical protein N3F63_08185, partial [Thermoplasmata archaeon]|nr:hypothetical protein [Thermoplasmata archaeon]